VIHLNLTDWRSHICTYIHTYLHMYMYIYWWRFVCHCEFCISTTKVAVPLPWNRYGPVILTILLYRIWISRRPI